MLRALWTSDGSREVEHYVSRSPGALQSRLSGLSCAAKEARFLAETFDEIQTTEPPGYCVCSGSLASDCANNEGACNSGRQMNQ